MSVPADIRSERDLRTWLIEWLPNRTLWDPKHFIQSFCSEVILCLLGISFPCQLESVNPFSWRPCMSSLSCCGAGWHHYHGATTLLYSSCAAAIASEILISFSYPLIGTSLVRASYLWDCLQHGCYWHFIYIARSGSCLKAVSPLKSEIQRDCMMFQEMASEPKQSLL